ncbi:hypothetical protein [Streptococcus equi]|uniref:Similar to staphylokinase and streptokinase n=1 Tax=Streptococcus equi subsp. zooepidemicus TaxID=40041 RepID=A0A7Z8ZWP8_STRSZ|nr:hypothetical protein [Streptococcus equi]MCD3434025.1 hypothetical protein [Streptococcus equi subsp. zooepidemicus]VEF07032.1 similar to staphylokinase and streptokinase [Streptococcus equi subsp. zooepidemicus]HEL0610136.1 hypothetical protein [Streptococcus equi subsp. zooepidemicus]HEL0651150.1 hypothetical protein [Streptococcus equi subsp. zooepidemicus]HEL0692823.1 hypothetical protein [Streptococcus equi subsp. zooepidemicus]
MKRKHLVAIVKGITMTGSALLGATQLQAYAITSEIDGGRIHYQENKGPQLMINIEGYDINTKEQLYPHYMTYNISPGSKITKKELLEMVTNSLHNAVGNPSPDQTYEAIDFIDKPVIKLQLDKDGKSHYKRDFIEIPITEEGFTIPTLKEYNIFELKLLLDTKVNYRKKPKPAIQYTQLAANTPVTVVHRVSFVTLPDTRSLEEFHVLKTQTKEIEKKVGDTITQEDLRASAEELFNQTDLNYHGYMIKHRISTSVSENQQPNNDLFVYDYKEDPFSHYIKASRPEVNYRSFDHADFINEVYFVTTTNTSLPRTQATISVTFIDKEQKQIIRKEEIYGQHLGTRQAVLEALKSQGKLNLLDKSGRQYTIDQLEQNQLSHYTIYLTAINHSSK